MKKRIISLLLFAALITSLFTVPVSAADTDSVIDPALTVSTTRKLTNDYKLVTSNDYAELYVYEKQGAIAVRNKDTGFIWHSSVPDDTLDRDGMTEALNSQLDSLFVLTYTVLNNNDAGKESYPINALAPEIKSENIENGVRLTYYVKDIFLEISVEVTLEKGFLNVSIPKEKLVEGKGTKEAMDRIIGKITKFTEKVRTDLAQLEEDGYSDSGIRKSLNKIEELEELISGVDSVIGIAYVQSRATIILRDELQIYLLGGGGQSEKGVYKRAIDSGKLGDKTSQYQAKVVQVKSDLDLASRDFGLLKTSIKYGGIVNIEMLPNFGAAGDFEDGYVFYPDGSGAITYNTSEHGVGTDISYETSIYSEQTVNMGWENLRDDTGIKRTMLPVYGTKKNDHAFLAVVEEGDTNASIRFVPSGNTVNLNRISSVFQYRNTITISSSSEYADGIATVYEANAQDFTPRVQYRFLVGDEANYSGMANIYRTYLVDNKKINKSSLLNGETPFAIDINAATWSPSLFSEGRVALTTTEETEKIVAELKAEGIKNAMIHMTNYSKYVSPTTLDKIPSVIGGKSGMKHMVETTRESGANIFLSQQVVDADTFNLNINEAKLALNSNQRIYEFQTWWWKLFSPVYVKEQMPKYKDQLEALGSPGVAHVRMGSMLMADYNGKYSISRDQCADIWAEIYADMRKTAPTASYSGNQYLLANNDWLMDIPMSSTGYSFSDESVPFYQMVVHGLIPYTAKPFNQFYDKQAEKLQTIEYGCVPLYKITYRDNYELRRMYYGFTSQYERVKSDMIETYKEFNGKLAEFTEQYMIRHEYLADDVVAVTYSGGKTIYINYTSKDFTTDTGVSIPAIDYVVK